MPSTASRPTRGLIAPGRLSLALLALAMAVQQGASAAQPRDTEDLDAWFEDDAEFRTAQVNEGQLEFLADPPGKPVHHHHNRMTLDAASVENGWVQMEQCHENLDAVPRAQILYREGRIRDLEVMSAESIGRAWVEGPSVQMEDIRSGARLCVQAYSRALTDNGDGTFSLRNGPFMRRFLDGYYPMRVSMDIRLATDRLRFLDITPRRQDGFRVWESGRSVHFDAWFEGRLNTEVRFETQFCDNPGTSSC